MKTEEVVKALRRLKVETGSLACIGCGYEQSCGVHGCRIMREGLDLVERLTDRYARYAEEIAVLQEKTRWVPEMGEMVLAIASGKPMGTVTLLHALEMATLYNDGWFLETWPDWEDATVTHWMPLPDGPEVTGWSD
nr:MAG TPA: Protein of unknown function (DUF551) [Caudoviricetes sp.]